MLSRAQQLVRSIRPLTIPKTNAAKNIKVMVVGGSIGGLAAAVSLRKAGAKVKVFEANQTRLGGGSGLGIDSVSIGVLKGLGVDLDGLYSEEMVPMPMEKYLDRNGRYLYQREDLPLFSCYWQDVYNMLMEQLPEKAVIFDREVVEMACGAADESGGGSVALTFQDGDRIRGDLAVGADGVLSPVRRAAFGPRQLRFSGYSAWRGAVGAEDVEPDIFDRFRDAYPHLGTCHYYELGNQSHSTFFELGGRFLNWNVFLRSDEPMAEEGKVSLIPDDERLSKLKEDTKDLISPEFFAMISSTKRPYLHDIYDADPAKTFVNEHKDVVLVGDAAHPTTPHALRGANMALQDGWALGKCLAAAGGDDLPAALALYDRLRVAECRRSVLQARHLGRVKNGLHAFGADFQTMDPDDFESAYHASGVGMAVLPSHPVFANPDFDPAEEGGQEGAAGLSVLGWDHVVLEAKDVGSLANFYTELLGLEACRRPPQDQGGDGDVGGGGGPGGGGAWLRVPGAGEGAPLLRLAGKEEGGGERAGRRRRRWRRRRRRGARTARRSGGGGTAAWPSACSTWAAWWRPCGAGVSRTPPAVCAPTTRGSSRFSSKIQRGIPSRLQIIQEIHHAQPKMTVTEIGCSTHEVGVSPVSFHCSHLNWQLLQQAATPYYYFIAAVLWYNMDLVYCYSVVNI